MATFFKPWRNVCAIALIALCANPAAAAVRVTAVPAAAAARGISLAVNDALEWPTPFGQALSLCDAYNLQDGAALAAPITLQRTRGGVSEPLTLPLGRWDLRLAPITAAGTALGAEAALTDAIEHAARGEFKHAAERFEVAAEREPNLAHCVWRQAANAFERYLSPDRNDQLLYAKRALAALESTAAPHTVDPQLRAETLRTLASAQIQNRLNADADVTLQAAQTAPCRCMRDAELALLDAFVGMRGGNLDRAQQALDRARRVIDTLSAQSPAQGIEDALWLQRSATLEALKRENSTRADDAFARAFLATQRVAPGSSLLGKLAFNAHLHALERRRLHSAEHYGRAAYAAFMAAAPYSLEMGQARAALAEVYLRRADYAAAAPLLREAAQAAQLQAPKSYEALSLQLQLADVYTRQQQFAAATSALDAVARALLVPDLLAETALRADLALYRGALALAQQRWSDALDDAAAALALSSLESKAGATNAVQAEVIVAEARLGLGNFEATLAQGQTTLAKLRQSPGTHLLQARVAAVMARAAKQLGRNAQAIGAYQSAILAVAEQRLVLGGSESVAARWAAQYQDHYHELFALLAAKVDSDPQALETLLYWQRHYRALQRAHLTRGSDAVAGSVEIPTTTNASLAANEVRLRYLIGPAGSMVLVQRSNAPIQLVMLTLERAHLAEQVDRARLLLASDKMDQNALMNIGKSLHRDLLGPLATKLPEVFAASRWRIQNDGPLHQLPWSLLHDGRRYLIEHKELVMHGDASTKAGLSAAPQIATITAFADPLNGAPAALRDATVARELPGARAELEMILHLFPNRAKGWHGASVTEGLVRQLAPTADVLHFALHTETNNLTPMNSALMLASEPQADSNSRRDGKLSAAEIANELQLNAQLVVLSSCASAGGSHYGGDGLIGLISALHQAGAREIVASLWPINDRATAQWMQHFYRAQARGSDPVAALAAAQRQWLQQARADQSRSAISRWWAPVAMPERALHPSYWAAFQIYSGD